MIGKCIICRPAPVAVDGADHTGLDAFLRCPRCQTRTRTHVECERLDASIEAILRKEWRHGNLTRERYG